MGPTLAIKLPINFDFKMALTQADTKKQLWEGILTAVIETELKEDLETIMKTCTQMKATSSLPAWAQRVKELPAPGCMPAAPLLVVESMRPPAGGGQPMTTTPTQQVIRSNPPIPIQQPPPQLQVPMNSSPSSTSGMVGYTQTPSNTRNDSAMTVMARA